MEYSDNWRSVMAAKTSAAKKKAGSGGRSAKKTTSGVKAVHSTKPSGRTTSKTTAHKKNGSGSTSKASRTGTNTYRRRTIEEMNEYQDHIACLLYTSDAADD